MEPDISVLTAGQVWLGLNSNNCTAASLQPGLLTKMFLFCPSLLCNPLTSSDIRGVTDSKTSSAEEHLTIGCVCSQAEGELKRPQIPLAEGTLPGSPRLEGAQLLLLQEVEQLQEKSLGEGTGPPKVRGLWLLMRSRCRADPLRPPSPGDRVPQELGFPTRGLTHSSQHPKYWLPGVTCMSPPPRNYKKSLIYPSASLQVQNT